MWYPKIMDEHDRRRATLENARFLREVSRSLIEEIREKMQVSRELYRRSVAFPTLPAQKPAAPKPAPRLEQHDPPRGPRRHDSAA